MDFSVTFPQQNLPYNKKGKKWRRECVDWAASRAYFTYSPVRQSVVKMKTNYDLLNGIIHMEDVARIINPGDISTAFLPDKIQHYPIMNSKLNTLRGEEAARVFDWRVIITNPFSVSQIEENKKAEFFKGVQQIVEDPNISQEEAEKQVSELKEYYDYNWQDFREIGCNELLRHYQKEQHFPQKFNDGFVDACAVSVEAYQCGIMGGEPFLVRLNPMKLRTYHSGYSDRIEDADVIVYEDYWSRGKIFEAYYDDLDSKDVKKLMGELPAENGIGPTGAAGNYDETYQFRGEDGILIEEGDGLDFPTDALPELDGGIGSNLLPYDVAGNVLVTRVWWRSKRLIYLVKSFNQETGEEEFDFYPETYVVNTAAGEKAKKLWINEMWEGTRIANDIYVCIRPCLVQHNSLSNPSRCHAGIIGTIYNINESKPYSLVDMMKPYNYLYDAVHAKLIDLIATNWGKLLEMDLAQKPKDWKIEKWMYFARANKVLIKDSFREGEKGAASGKLAGGLNNASKGYIDADWGQSIQNYIDLLEWTKESMSELVGINRQREGNTYNRETVGGIERAVLQSSYITDWLFMKHDDTKRRVLEAFLEEAKGALRGRSKKFEYTMSDKSRRILTIDGDLFCESDYGLVVDSSQDIQKFNNQLETIAQATLQNNLLDLASIAKLYATGSLNEKVRIIESGQKRAEEKAAQAAQQQQQLEQQKVQAEMQMKQAELQQKEKLAELDAQTRIQVAQINSKAEELRLGIYEEQNNVQLRNRELDIEEKKLAEEIRQFDKELRQDEKEMEMKKEVELKKIAASKQKTTAKK